MLMDFPQSIHAYTQTNVTQAPILCAWGTALAGSAVVSFSKKERSWGEPAATLIAGTPACSAERKIG